MSDFMQLFGVLGALCVSIPFLLGSSMNLPAWKPDTWRFILVNLTGAIILAISLLFHFNLGSFLIEVFWISGGCYAIYKKLKNK